MIISNTPVYQTFNIDGVDHILPENAFTELLNGTAIMVDVREDYEYMSEYISLNDVYHFPMSSILVNLKNIPDDKPIIIICQRGVRSTKIANLLDRNGFKNSVNLDGGFVAWKEQGLPYEAILPDPFESRLGSCSCSH